MEDNNELTNEKFLEMKYENLKREYDRQNEYISELTNKIWRKDIYINELEKAIQTLSKVIVNKELKENNNDR